MRNPPRQAVARDATEVRMGEMLDWWLSGGDWADLKQNRRIEDLASSHAADVAAVRSSVSRQTSALDGRLDRLERALLAFVELEDTRAQLNDFADAAAARRFARDLANRLLGADAPPTPPAPPADLPGYWLSPAVKALVADLYPGTADGAALRAEARRRDDERADLFDVLVAAIGARESTVAAGVNRWFPRTADLDRAGRVIATEVARGRFGSEARAALAAQLMALRDEHGVDALAPLIFPDIASALPTPAPDDRRNGDAASRGPAAQRAATDLAALAAVVAPVGDAVAAERPTVRDDPLLELLAVLINEGAPGEAPVLHRMATIRTSLAGVGVPAPPAMQTSGDAAGTVWQLLGAWLRDRDASATHGLAREVLAPVLDGVAASLEVSASAPAPTTHTIAVAGGSVVVGAEGTEDGAWRERAERTAIDPPAWVRPAALAGAALALVCVVLAIVAAPGWWAAAVIAAIGATAGWLWHARARAEAGRGRAEALADGQRRIDEAVAALRRDQAAALERAAMARRARAAIQEACATGSVASPA
jgi:hypothetical protein